MKSIGEMPASYKPGDETSAVTCFMTVLGAHRGTAYAILSQPDKTARNSRAADFVFEEEGTGRKVAVEHTQLIKPSEMEAASLLMQGKSPRVPSAAALKRDGIESMRINPDSVAPMSHSMRLDADQWETVRSVILAKLSKGQLQATDAEERLLVIEDSSLGLPDSRMTGVEIEFSEEERDGIDGCFVILDQEVVRMVWGAD